MTNHRVLDVLVLARKMMERTCYEVPPGFPDIPLTRKEKKQIQLLLEVYPGMEPGDLANILLVQPQVVRRHLKRTKTEMEYASDDNEQKNNRSSP